MVYQIPCAQCNKVYIGETGRPLKTKISEHNRAVATGDVWNANATHWMKTNHDMDWDIVDGQTSRRRGRSRRVCTSGPGECTTYSGSTPSPVWNSLIIVASHLCMTLCTTHFTPTSLVECCVLHMHAILINHCL